jgi:DNA-binding XRE family transcriptional regulator
MALKVGRKYAELRSRLSPAARAKAKALADSMLREMPLQEIRRARHLTQEQLAETLAATQPEISKIEKRTDLYISTLRRYIEAMGGTLDIVARFPDGDVRINQFHTLDPDESPA